MGSMDGTQPDKQRVLFVDDDCELLRLLSELAETWGYEVRSQLDSRQALAEAIEFQPDLVVLDAMMPYMDGYQVFDVLRREPRTADLPVLFLSGTGRDVKNRIRGLKKGAWDFMTKPVDPEELRARIAHHMEQRARTRVSVDREIDVVRRTAVFLNHCINNLLCTIQLAADLSADEGDPAQQKRAAMVAKNVRQIHDVISKLRSIKRVVLTSYVGDERMLDLEKSIESEAPLLAGGSEVPEAPDEEE